MRKASNIIDVFFLIELKWIGDIYVFSHICTTKQDVVAYRHVEGYTLDSLHSFPYFYPACSNGAMENHHQITKKLTMKFMET